VLGGKKININLRFFEGKYFNEDELDNLKDFCGNDFSLKSASDISTISQTR
jgi:hypothetical protein